MIRAEFAVAAIALGATVVMALDAIKEGCTSAHAKPLRLSLRFGTTMGQ